MQSNVRESHVDAPEGGQLPRLDARRRREYERFRIVDPDAEVPERDLAPDEEILSAHGYTVADLPAPWERLTDRGASSR